ncbi:hypothetical protein MKX54_16785 [Alkalihalobacillus sp. FSL R5-0424]
MQTLVAPEVVGAKLVEWYSCIVANDIEQAEESKTIAEEMLTQMREHETVINHYKLILLSHDLMLKKLNTEVSPEELERMKIETEASDQRLKYLYYYMTAQYEIYKSRFKSALRIFKIAHNYLNHTNDKFEIGEFYSRYGFCYYRLDDYENSIKFIKKGLEALEGNRKFEERYLKTKLLIAYIATELEDYEKAENIYTEILKCSHFYPRLHTMVNRGLALNRIRQRKFNEAKHFLLESLEVKEISGTVTEVQNKYNLANTMFRLGESKDAKKLLDQAEEKALEYNLVEQIAKSTITRGLYQYSRMDMVEEGLQVLYSNELFFEYSEMALEIADFFEGKKDFENAFKYLKKHKETPTNKNILEELI